MIAKLVQCLGWPSWATTWRAVVFQSVCPSPIAIAQPAYDGCTCPGLLGRQSGEQVIDGRPVSDYLHRWLAAQYFKPPWLTNVLAQGPSEAASCARYAETERHIQNAADC